MNVYAGPWWCPSCSKDYPSTLATSLADGEQVPACPKCGTPLEEQGTGDDDPS